MIKCITNQSILSIAGMQMYTGKNLPNLHFLWAMSDLNKNADYKYIVYMYPPLIQKMVHITPE